MFRSIVCGAIAAMVLAAPALADDIPASLKLEEVTVNPRSAQLVRMGEVNVPAGSHEIVLTTLPDNLVASSVQVEGSSATDVEIGSVDVSRIVLDPAQQNASERKQLEQELKSLRRDRQRHEQAARDAQFRRQSLERLTGGALISAGTKGAGAALTPEQVSGLLTLTGNELAQTSQAILDAQAAIERIDEQRALIQRKLSTFAAQPKAHTRVAIRVNAAEAGPVQLSLKYTVPDAGWRPVYDARLALPKNGGKAELELVSRAMVFQRSAEAWENVKLKLSTARVSGRTAAPVLKPVAIGPQPRADDVVMRDLKEEAAPQALKPQVSFNSAAGGRVSQPRTAKKARQQTAEVVNAGFHAVYTVSGMASVPNSGAQKSVRIGAADMPVDMRIDTVPMLDPQGYLTAVFKAPGEAPMLAGEVFVFRDGVMAGKTRLKQVSPGEKVELGFGRDDLVRVVRTKVDDTSGSSGIITEHSNKTRAFNTVVENLHTFPVTVRLLERMPYSTHEDVGVEMLAQTTRPTRTDPDKKRGLVEWDLKLAAGGKSEVRFGYKISHPKDLPVVLSH